MGDNSAMNKMKGKTKQKAGEAMGDDRMRAEGRTDHAKGKAKGAMEDAKESLQGVKDSLKGKRR
ncbi:CsbD family protein [Streptomyces lydicus]|uniref:CsbD family protein n=1 Tax=Streptomyces lydicus TaxID=47763 RepID=UPI0028702699|nr:CsbD family protein [Streptomyces lydicus]